MATSTALRVGGGVAPRLVVPLVIALLAVPVVTAAPGGLMGVQLGLLRMTSPPAAIPAVGDVAEPPHNCRMYGAIGADLPDGMLYYDLRVATNSLWYLSPANDDGWGFVFYPTPGVIQDPCEPDFPFRGHGVAMYDPNHYTPRVEDIDALEPFITLGHIRQGTSGCDGVGVRNPHPFFRTAHGRTWVFEHNGGASLGRLATLIDGLDPAYLDANPPNCSYLPECEPCTLDANNVVDSELYFIWVMENIEEHGWNVPGGICAALDSLIAAGEGGALNFLLSDGTGLWAFRRGGSSYTLYYHFEECGYAKVASRIPDPNEPNWVELDPNLPGLIDLVTGELIENVRDYNSPELLVDCAFNASADSVALRNNGVGQDWYESRNDDPALLTLDTSTVGGNASKKAALRNQGVARNAYLAQEFTAAQSGFMTVNFDVYVDRIEDNGTYDRTALIYIGDDSVSQLNPPTGTSNERFVCAAFYDATPGDTGNDLQLRARTLATQSHSATSAWTLLASGLSYDTWYRVKLVLDVAEGTYDVFLDDYLVGNSIPKYNGYASNAVTHISFSADSDGRGDFYVDSVAAATVDPAPDPSIHGYVTWPNGEPAANVKVSCLAHACLYGTSAMTNADGYYHLDNLPPSTYRVRARCRVNCTGYGADECPVVYDGCDAVILDMTIRTQWWLCPDIPCAKGDSTDDPAKAEGPRASDSSQAAPAVGIGGVVRWNCGTPLEAAAYVTVTAKRICAPDVYTAVSDGKGNYFIKLPAGKYNVTAQIRVDGVTFTGLACEVAVDGTGLVTRDLTLLKKLPYACMDCTPTPN